MGLWRRYLDWRRRHVAAIDLTPEGFRLSHGKASAAVAWDDVRQITAFKRDLYTTDCICLLLAVRDGIVEIDERMAGFMPFRESMERLFNLSPQWFLEIMSPAFDITPRHLFTTEPNP